MTMRYEDLKTLKKIAAVSKGRSTLRKIREELHALLVTPELKSVREQVKDAHDEIAHLSYFFDCECRHCGKRLEFGYTVCVVCADERGP